MPITIARTGAGTAIARVGLLGTTTAPRLLLAPSVVQRLPLRTIASLKPTRTSSLILTHLSPSYSTRRGVTTAATTPASSSSSSSSSSGGGNTGGSSGPNPNPNPNEPPKTAYQRFKDLTKTYGSYAILMYLALSAVDFSLVLFLVHMVGAEHIGPYVHKMVHQYRVLRHGHDGADAMDAADKARAAADAAEEAAQDALAGGKDKRVQRWWQNKTIWAEVALAYPIHKIVLLPVRAGLTVAWTPKVVNWLRARGWIGTVSSSDYERCGLG